MIWTKTAETMFLQGMSGIIFVLVADLSWSTILLLARWENPELLWRIASDAIVRTSAFLSLRISVIVFLQILFARDSIVG
jgi:hypothetical protein